MKILYILFLALLQACLTVNLKSQQTAEQEASARFQETVVLSENVKEFEKTIGINPSEALTKSEKEQSAHSMLYIWIHKKGSFSYDNLLRIMINVEFETAKENIPLKGLALSRNDYSFYYRMENEFGSRRSVITKGFLNTEKPIQVMEIIHEDLHANFDLPPRTEELVVTPLGYIAAEKFLKESGDKAGVEKIKYYIKSYREISEELGRFSEKAQKLFNSLPLDKAREKIIKLLDFSPNYSKKEFYNKIAFNKQNAAEALEAKVSHDLDYWDYFDEIVSLYEKVGDFKILFEDLKKSPQDRDKIRGYLKELSIKYIKSP